MMNNQLVAPTKIPKDIKVVNEKEAPPQQGFGVAGMEGLGGSSGGVIGSVFGSGTAPKVKAQAPTKVAISGGVATGLLLQKTVPLYPPIAKAARVQGTVVLQATISKGGTIENLRVISGNAMLQGAALDAVRSWRYRPYLLNGEPVEVETTVNVVFTLGS
jgi:protein TonB